MNEQASIRVGITDRMATRWPMGTPVSVTSTLGVLVMDTPAYPGVPLSDADGRQYCRHGGDHRTRGRRRRPAEVTFRPGLPAALDLTANPNRLPADGDQGCGCRPRVSDGAGAVMSPMGYPIEFLTTAGTLKAAFELCTTTRGGQATADLKAPLSWVDVVTSCVPGVFEHAVEIEFVPAPPYTLTLEAAPRKVPADGVSTAVLTATVRDRRIALVEDGTPVVFAGDHGG